MPTEQSGGTQTAVINTEHTLATITSNKTCCLVVDCVNMALGDTLELRIYTKVRSASTERVAYFQMLKGAQDYPIVYSVPVPANISFKATLKQTAGTGRSYEWAVVSI